MHGWQSYGHADRGWYELVPCLNFPSALRTAGAKLGRRACTWPCIPFKGALQREPGDFLANVQSFRSLGNFSSRRRLACRVAAHKELTQRVHGIWAQYNGPHSAYTLYFVMSGCYVGHFGGLGTRYILRP